MIQGDGKSGYGKGGRSGGGNGFGKGGRSGGRSGFGKGGRSDGGRSGHGKGGRGQGKTQLSDLGRRKTLTVESETEFGVYLTDGKDRVLLPKKEIPEGVGLKDEVTVFLYLDSMDRPIATTVEPLVTMDHPAALDVKDVNNVPFLVNI